MRTRIVTQPPKDNHPGKGFMSATPRISVIIPIFRPSPALPRLLSGLASQRLYLDELEVRLADHQGRLDYGLVEDWRGLLDPARLVVDIGPPGSCPRSRLANRSLARSSGRTMLVLDPEDRLHPEALRRFDQALHQSASPAALAVAHSLRLGPFAGLPGSLWRAPENPADKLDRCDGMGPRPAMSRTAWDAGLRYRSGCGLPAWDLGLQAREAGLETVRVRKTLTTVVQDPPMFRDQDEERGRARLVTEHPGAFATAALAWALAVLRREPWALNTPGGRIPTPREVDRQRQRQVRKDMRDKRDYPQELWDGLLSPAV